MSKNYYDILEVPKNASTEDIKKSYRKLAMKYHPDRNSGDKESEEKFKEISEAFDVLSDPEKKSRYDRIGSVDGPSGNPFGGSPFEDIFGDIFGSFNRRGPKKGGDLRVKVSLNLNDIIFGTKKKIKYTRHSACSVCNGLGGKDLSTCPPCNGSGIRTMVQNTPFGQIRQSASCNHCSGSGKIIKDPCKSCSGSGTTVTQEMVEVEIPKGSISGSYFSMPKMGNFLRDGIPGDLQIVIEEVPDNKFKRDDINLIYEDGISVVDAILGVHKSLQIPHGTEIKYTIEPGTNHGSYLRIKGKGIPDLTFPGNWGDLLIKINLKIPKKINLEEKDLLEKLKRLPNFN